MKLVELPELRLIGLEVRARWDELDAAMQASWSAFLEEAPLISHVVPGGYLDVSLAVWNEVHTQLVCAEVREFDELPDGMIALTVPAQRYGWTEHKGNAAAIAESFGKLYKWTRRQGYRADEFKIDRGYTEDGSPAPHQLYVRLSGQP